MRTHHALKILKIAVFIVVVSAICGFAIMLLWNWLAPTLFAGHHIDFWQAVGLFFLSKILFGGFPGRGGRGNRWRHRMRERWESMTPEEQEKFRDRMGHRCGHSRPNRQPEPQP